MRNKRLLRWVGLFLGLAMTLSSAAGETAALPAKQAKAKFKEVAWDFGKVKQGEILSHEFLFRNEGDAPLLIQRVSTSCGCTAALASDEKIEPGKEGKIKTSFDTRNYSGKVVKSIFVESNDADNARRELSITVDIDIPPQPKIDLDRFDINLGLGLLGEEASAKTTIRNLGKLELIVEIAAADRTVLIGGRPAAFPIKIAAGKSTEIEIKFTGQDKPGMLRDYVLIKSNDPSRSTLSLYISRYVITRLELKNLFIKYKKILEEKN